MRYERRTGTSLSSAGMPCNLQLVCHATFTIAACSQGSVTYSFCPLVGQGWDVERLYYGRNRKPAMDEEGVQFEPDLHKFLGQCDVVSINTPLTDKTRFIPAETCII